MNTICIARWNDARGKELAKALAAKLGYSCLGREDLVEEATKAGIAIGKLETAMLKPHLFNDRLLLEKERYIAFTTARLCERALTENIVYHGRTGHLLLPSVSHVLRVRVEENTDDRIASAMQRLNVSYDKARKFVTEVDQDIRRWVKTMYGKDWEANSLYDMVVNLDQMEVGNAATALCAVATLPEFQETPASHQVIENLRLASEVRLEMARDPRTATGHFQVTSNKGNVLVTYQPRDMAVADAITDVVLSVEGVREVHATMASSHVLWIQERYEPDSDACRKVVELAKDINAAVDLMQVTPNAEQAAPQPNAQAAPAAEGALGSAPDGGIEEDDEAEAAVDEGLESTYNLLLREGVAGGTRATCSRPSRGEACISPQVKYFLVVLGDVYLDKDPSTRTRLRREMAASVVEELKAPVVGVDELKKVSRTGVRQLLGLIPFIAITVLVVFLALTHQAELLDFLTGESTGAKAAAAVAVAVATPLFAFCYGTFTHRVLKMFRIE